jgi:hypothetical protein
MRPVVNPVIGSVEVILTRFWTGLNHKYALLANRVFSQRAEASLIEYHTAVCLYRKVVAIQRSPLIDLLAMTRTNSEPSLCRQHRCVLARTLPTSYLHDKTPFAVTAVPALPVHLPSPWCIDAGIREAVI